MTTLKKRREEDNEHMSGDVEDLDPRWKWEEFRTLGSSEPIYYRDRCLHDDVVPVESGGKTVARLCLTCDQQLPAHWQAQGIDREERE